MALTPRLVVEVFEHINYKGRKVTVIDSVVNTEEVGLQDIISVSYTHLTLPTNREV